MNTEVPDQALAPSCAHWRSVNPELLDALIVTRAVGPDSCKDGLYRLGAGPPHKPC